MDFLEPIVMLSFVQATRSLYSKRTVPFKSNSKSSEHSPRIMASKSDSSNRANQMNPNHPAYWQARGQTKAPNWSSKAAAIEKAHREKLDSGMFQHRVESRSRASVDDPAVGKNVKRVQGIVRDVCGPHSFVTKEGSRGKSTAIQNSDIDLLVHTPEPISRQQRRDLAARVQEDVRLGGEVTIGKTAIQVKPTKSPKIDLVPAKTTYSAPKYGAIGDFQGNQSAINAVKAYKQGMHADTTGAFRKLDGRNIEQLALRCQTRLENSESDKSGQLLYRAMMKEQRK